MTCRAKIEKAREVKFILIHQLPKDLMERLDLYKVDPNKASARVKEARAMFDDFIVSKSDFIQEHGLTPIVHGSLIFDDPKNLDFNSCFVGPKEDDDLEGTIQSTWEEELSPKWNFLRPPDLAGYPINGDMFYVNFDRLAEHAQALTENWKGYVEESDFDIFLDFLKSLPVLTGDYPYSTPEEAENFKAKYLEIVNQNRLLSAYTIWGLEQTLIDREIRRAGVADHQTGEDLYDDPTTGLFGADE